MMELTVIFETFLLFIIGLAAESSSNLTCKVRRQPHGSFMYLLSRPPGSRSCTTSWENQNKTVIARSSTDISTPDLLLVQNLTDQFIIMKDCWNYLHHTRDCLEGFEEAHCRVNCSIHLDKVSDPPTVNSTLICIFDNICLHQGTVLVFSLVPTGILAVIVGCLYFCKRRRPVALTASYTPANDKIKERVEIQEMDIV